MIKKFMTASVVATLLMVGTASAETLAIGTEGDYAPFNYVTAAGEIKGFDYDIGQAVCAEIKVDCVWSTNEWAGIIPALQAKKFDVMIASMAINPDRKTQVDFTNPYYFNAMRFVARKDLGLKDISPEALKGKVIGTQSGSVAVEALQEFFPDSEVKLYPTMSEVFLDMENGRLDLILEGQMAFTEWLAKEESGCCAFVGELRARHGRRQRDGGAQGRRGAARQAQCRPEDDHGKRHLRQDPQAVFRLRHHGEAEDHERVFPLRFAALPAEV